MGQTLDQQVSARRARRRAKAATPSLHNKIGSRQILKIHRSWMQWKQGVVIYMLLYTRSPLEDSRLFGPSPWKILGTTYDKKITEQPGPWRKSSKRKSCYGDRVYDYTRISHDITFM